MITADPRSDKAVVVVRQAEPELRGERERVTTPPLHARYERSIGIAFTAISYIFAPKSILMFRSIISLEQVIMSLRQASGVPEPFLSFAPLLPFVSTLTPPFPPLARHCLPAEELCRFPVILNHPDLVILLLL
jgi:hypothetical protein